MCGWVPLVSAKPWLQKCYSEYGVYDELYIVACRVKKKKICLSQSANSCKEISENNKCIALPYHPMYICTIHVCRCVESLSIGIDTTNTYPALPHIETLVFFANNAMLGHVGSF